MADFHTPELLSIFTGVDRRSTTVADGVTHLLSGRWAVIDANGQAKYPGAGDKLGMYLVLEGTHRHIGDNTEFGAAPHNSTNAVELPSVKAAGAVALAYGVFRYRVGPEGCNPAETFNVEDMVTVDAYGRVIPSAVAGDEVARVEAVSTDANGVTELVLRTLGK